MSPATFKRFAWANVLYNLAVILWGAWVRVTGSGAGCGEHWPICNGEVIPRAPSIQTIIEFTHRVTSGLALIGVIALVVFARKAFPAGHVVRKGAWGSLALMIVEALLGAGLVLFRLVADDDSVARAFAMALHLINTLLLVGAMTLTAWWASGGKRIQLEGQGATGGMLGAALGSVVVLGASGALSALGNTLFPAVAGLEAHLAPTAHIVLKLAVFHPMLALAVGTWLVIVAIASSVLRPAAATRRAAVGLVALTLLQVGAGVLNIFLMAPAWLQLVHLLLADLLWITLVILAASALAEGAPRFREGSEPALSA